MNWLSKLFGRSTPAAEKTEYYERDNVGTRFTSADQAGAHRLVTRNAGIEEPCIDYCFKSESDARSTLMEVPCIKVARDSGNLVCTEILKFGVFKRYSDVDDAFIALLEGKDLTHDLWIAAKTAFERRGGQKVAEVQPSKNAAASKKAYGNTNAVKFSHEETRPAGLLGSLATYRYYNGPDKASAMAFLQKNPVTKGSFFLVVKTPDGVFCRDVQGFFEQ